MSATIPLRNLPRTSSCHRLMRAALWCVAFLAAAAPQIGSADQVAGVRQMHIHAAARGTALELTVWYPADTGGTPVVLGESPFFQGQTAMQDAPLAGDKLPLLMLSHGAGLGGNAQALSWLAVSLARQGFVVAAPTHPGNSGPHRSAAQTMQLWLRPADMAAALSALEKDRLFAARLDATKVGVLGLSMGGYTALAMAGVRIDPQRLARYCDSDERNPSLCQWVRKSGVDLHAMDMRDAARDYADPRIRFAMAIDPAPVDVLDNNTLGQVSIPVALVNLGRAGTIPATVDAFAAAQRIPRATHLLIEDASHFSLFPECKTGAAQRAQSAEIEEPICTDGDVRERRDIHAELVQLVVTTVRQALEVIHQPTTR